MKKFILRQIQKRFQKHCQAGTSYWFYRWLIDLLQTPLEKEQPKLMMFDIISANSGIAKDFQVYSDDMFVIGDTLNIVTPHPGKFIGTGGCIFDEIEFMTKLKVNIIESKMMSRYYYYRGNYMYYMSF